MSQRRGCNSTGGTLSHSAKARHKPDGYKGYSYHLSALPFLSVLWSLLSSNWPGQTTVIFHGQLNSSPELKPILSFVVWFPQQCAIVCCVLSLHFFDFQKARTTAYAYMYLLTTIGLTEGTGEMPWRLKALAALRGPRFDSQHPHGGLQPSMTTGPAPSSSLHRL